MDIEQIKNFDIAPIEQSYDKRDTILYALGLGYGADPLDAAELPFVYERNLKCLPSLVNVLCHPGFWAQNPKFGIDWVKILHAEQEFRMYAPMPPTGTIRGIYRISGVEDKGPGRGALLHWRGGGGRRTGTGQSTGPGGGNSHAAPPGANLSAKRRLEPAARGPGDRR
jgi:hypothetical protein